MTAHALPAGYERVRVGSAEAVAVPEMVPWLREVLNQETLYDHARVDRGGTELGGRQPAYALLTPMHDGLMVIRHNRHGGALAGLTGDRFFYPTRAPLELAISIRLKDASVPTPELLAYAVYRDGVFARSDVVTRMGAFGFDLAYWLAEGGADWRTRILDLAATLVAQLSRAGARHADLNSKNVLVGSFAPPLSLPKSREEATAKPHESARTGPGTPVLRGTEIQPSGEPLQGIVLDVDRVSFGWSPTDALAANLRRLDRSLRKRRELFGEQVTDDEIAELARKAAERM